MLLPYCRDAAAGFCYSSLPLFLLYLFFSVAFQLLLLCVTSFFLFVFCRHFSPFFFLTLFFFCFAFGLFVYYFLFRIYFMIFPFGFSLTIFPFPPPFTPLFWLSSRQIHKEKSTHARRKRCYIGLAISFVRAPFANWKKI